MQNPPISHNMTLVSSTVLFTDTKHQTTRLLHTMGSKFPDIIHNICVSVLCNVSKLLLSTSLVTYHS